MTTIQTAALAPLKVYIAGKIAGDPQYRRKFLAAHMELKNEGTSSSTRRTFPKG